MTRDEIEEIQVAYAALHSEQLATDPRSTSIASDSKTRQMPQHERCWLSPCSGFCAHHTSACAGCGRALLVL